MTRNPETPMSARRSMEAGAEKARARPAIQAFLGLAQADLIDRCLPFNKLQEARYLSYWSRLVMSKLIEEKATFEYTYFGTTLATYLRSDITGHTLDDSDVARSFDDVYDMNIRVVRDREQLFSAGTSTWEEHEMLEWYGVSIPLAKPSGEVWCLTFVDLEFRDGGGPAS